MSDLVRNPIDQFSLDAHLKVGKMGVGKIGKNYVSSHLIK